MQRGISVGARLAAAFASLGATIVEAHNGMRQVLALPSFSSFGQRSGSSSLVGRPRSRHTVAADKRAALKARNRRKHKAHA